MLYLSCMHSTREDYQMTIWHSQLRLWSSKRLQFDDIFEIDQGYMEYCGSDGSLLDKIYVPYR